MIEGVKSNESKYKAEIESLKNELREVNYQNQSLKKDLEHTKREKQTMDEFNQYQLRIELEKSMTAEREKHEKELIDLKSTAESDRVTEEQVWKNKLKEEANKRIKLENECEDLKQKLVTSKLEQETTKEAELESLKHEFATKLKDLENKNAELQEKHHNDIVRLESEYEENISALHREFQMQIETARSSFGTESLPADSKRTDFLKTKHKVSSPYQRFAMRAKSENLKEEPLRLSDSVLSPPKTFQDNIERGCRER